MKEKHTKSQTKLIGTKRCDRIPYVFNVNLNELFFENEII